jgi:hypothetical protein
MDKFEDRKPDRRKETKITMAGDTTFFTIPSGDKILVNRDRRLSKRRNRKKVVSRTGDDTIWVEDK